MSEYSIEVCPYCGSADYTETEDFRWKCSACGEIFDDFDEVFLEDENDDEVEDFESNEGMLDNLEDEQNLFNEFAYDDDGFYDDDYEAGIDDFNHDGFDDGEW